MFDPNFILLYVDNPGVSSAFYAELLGHPPVESSPTFALFALDSGVMLGLWSKHTVEPAAPAQFGGSELAFTVNGDTFEVPTTVTAWRVRRLKPHSLSWRGAVVA